MDRLLALLGEEPTTLVREISPRDGMFVFLPDRPAAEQEASQRHYFGVGRSALRCIRLALLAVGKAEVTSILDLPCGHGRVLRALKAAFPDARLTACDLDRDGVDFCARVFGATPVYSDERPDRIPIDDTFDLIWVGSLLTHLNAGSWIDFLKRFALLLADDGVLVFTTHGRFVAERMRTTGFSYGLAPESLQGVLGDYDRAGFGYRTYPQQSRYGISVASPGWTCAQLTRIPGLRLLSYLERGWDNHQVVVAFAREAMPGGIGAAGGIAWTADPA
jgi:SAM-dependent methyltransferase